MAVALLAVAPLACCPCPSALYALVAANPTVQLPLDESPHCDGGEWWYYSGRLAADDGKGYGIEAVVFHVPAAVIELPVDAWVAHFAVLDESGGVFLYDQVREFRPPVIGDAQPDGFDIATELVQMAGLAGKDHLTAAMADGAYAVDLLLEDAREAAVLHGGTGYVPYGADSRSFYYSRPRMRASGMLQVAGESCTVTGELWFDRQWGRNLTNPFLQWDWFSLRLDDGTDVMLYVFRGTDPPVALGTYVPAAGEPLPLEPGDFEITSTASWMSPHTGITYPSGWEIRLIPQDLAVTVTPVADDQELDTRATTLNIYWSGLCTVSGTRAGQPVSGFAYAELTNYGP